MAGHSSASLGARHAPHNWEYADATERAAATGFTSDDIGKEALQLDDFTSWTLTAITPTWQAKGGAAVTLASVAESGLGTEIAKAATPAGLFPAEADVSSATTTNIGAATTNKVRITGTVTITGFGTAAAGIHRMGRFSGVLTLTHNGTSLILPSGANITTAAGDTFGAYSLGSGNWVVLFYQRASGAALVGGSGTGTKTLRQWTAMDNQPPSSGPATFDSYNLIAVLDFSAGTDNSAVFVGIIPEAADFTTGIKVRIKWIGAATSGDVIWTSAFERGNTDLDSDSFATAVSATTTTDATQGIPNTTAIDHSSSEIDGVTAGDLFRLKITRDADAGGDTMAALAHLIAVEIQQR